MKSMPSLKLGDDLIFLRPNENISVHGRDQHFEWPLPVIMARETTLAQREGHHAILAGNLSFGCQIYV